MKANGAQCTVCWHVDDLKVPHVNKVVVTTFSIKLADLYKGWVKTHRGNALDYLGIDLDYGSYHQGYLLIVSTITYLTKVLKERPTEFRGSNIDPYSDYVFTIRGDDD